MLQVAQAARQQPEVNSATEVSRLRELNTGSLDSEQSKKTTSASFPRVAFDGPDLAQDLSLEAAKLGTGSDGSDKTDSGSISESTYVESIVSGAEEPRVAFVHSADLASETTKIPADASSCVQEKVSWLISSNVDEGRIEAVQANPGLAEALAARAEETQVLMISQHRASMASLTRYVGGPYAEAYWRGKVVEVAVRRAADGCVWTSSRPLAAVLCKPWYPWVLWALIAMTAMSSTTCLSLILGRNLFAARAYRFTPLATRDDRSVAAVWAVGLVRDGCADDFSAATHNSTISSNGAVTLTFAEHVTSNGFWFRTGPGLSGADPVRFIFERSISTSEDRWELIGGSGCSWMWSGEVAYNSKPYPTTAHRNATETFDLGVPIIWIIHSLATKGVITIGSIAVLIAVAYSRYLQSRTIVVAMCGLIAACNGAACLVYLVNGQGPIALVAGGHFIVDGMLPVTLLVAEARLRLWLGLAGVAYSATILLHYLVLLGAPHALVGSDGLSLFRSAGLIEGAFFLALFVHAQVSRSRSRRRALSIIRHDWEAYNRCWSVRRVIDGPAIDALFAFTSVICRNRSAAIRQPRRPSMDASPPGISIAADPDRRLVHRLEQLFAQAAGLDIFLRGKVKKWALTSGGQLPLQEGGFEIFARIIEAGLLEKVKWAPLKTPDRVLEKLYRVYDMDAGRLLDCCRQAIYFDGAAALLQCLQAVVRDVEVTVMRVTNRLRDGYDTAATAGYRDVMLNLTIATSETRQLGLDAVVCELQLALTDFAQIKVRALSLKFLFLIVGRYGNVPKSAAIAGKLENHCFYHWAKETRHWGIKK